VERRLEVHHHPTPANESIARPTPLADPADLPPTVESVDRVDPVDQTRGDDGTVRGDSALLTDRLVERLGQRRLAEIRSRLASGAYGSREVIAALAVRLLESGDLA